MIHKILKFCLISALSHEKDGFPLQTQFRSHYENFATFALVNRRWAELAQRVLWTLISVNGLRQMHAWIECPGSGRHSTRTLLIGWDWWKQGPFAPTLDGVPEAVWGVVPAAEVIPLRTLLLPIFGIKTLCIQNLSGCVTEMLIDGLALEGLSGKMKLSDTWFICIGSPFSGSRAQSSCPSKRSKSFKPD